MAAYLVAQVSIITDKKAYEKYAELSNPLVSKYNGKMIVKDGSVKTLDGDDFCGWFVIIKFPDKSDLQAFYDSPEYQKAKNIRLGCSIAQFLSVDGLLL